MVKYLSALSFVLFLFVRCVFGQEYQVWKDPQTGKEYYKWRTEDGHPILTDFPPNSPKASVYQKPSEKSSVGGAQDPVVGQTPTGKPIYEGPQGGRYHFSEGGNKEYDHPRSGAQDPVVGQTPTGKPIYEGPRGGHYTITKGGNKSYQPRSGSSSSSGSRSSGGRSGGGRR